MKKFLFGISICLVFALFSSCDLFPHENKDETDSMDLITYEQLKNDIANNADWTKGYWNLSISQIEKTKKSTNIITVDNYPFFYEYDKKGKTLGINLLTLYLLLIEPTQQELEDTQKKSQYTNPLSQEDEDKNQYIETLESCELYLSSNKKTFILDIITSLYDKKYELTTDIKNRYKLVKIE